MSINPHGKAIELHVCIDVAKPFSLLNLRSSLDLSSMEDSIRLWIALAPPQMEELRTRHRIRPDEYTSRIDLSATQMPLGRDTDVQWCQTYNYFEYSFLQVEITALGYFGRWKRMYWRRFDLVSFVGMDFLLQRNVMSREDCSIRSLIPWLPMSQYVSVLLVTDEWASCRLLYFRFCLSRASCCKLA